MHVSMHKEIVINTKVESRGRAINVEYLFEGPISGQDIKSPFDFDDAVTYHRSTMRASTFNYFLLMNNQTYPLTSDKLKIMNLDVIYLRASA